MNFPTKLIPLGTMVLALTACNAPEPTEADITQAVQHRIDDQNAALRRQFPKASDNNFIKLVAVQKLSCAPGDGGGYTCDVSVTTISPTITGLAKGTQNTKLRLNKGNDGWLIVDG